MRFRTINQQQLESLTKLNSGTISATRLLDGSENGRVPQVVSSIVVQAPWHNIIRTGFTPTLRDNSQVDSRHTVPVETVTADKRREIMTLDTEKYKPFFVVYIVKLSKTFKILIQNVNIMLSLVIFLWRSKICIYFKKTWGNILQWR